MPKTPTPTSQRFSAASRPSEANLGHLGFPGSSIQTKLFLSYRTHQASSHLSHRASPVIDCQVPLRPSPKKTAIGNTVAISPTHPANPPSNPHLPWNHLWVCTHIPELCVGHTHSQSQWRTACAQGFPPSPQQGSPQFTVRSSSTRGNKKVKVTGEQWWLLAALWKWTIEPGSSSSVMRPPAATWYTGNIHPRHERGQRHRWDQLQAVASPS